MLGWIAGWLIACGVMFANIRQLEEIGLSGFKFVVTIAALIILWPLAIGWALGKGITVKVSLPRTSCGCDGKASVRVEEDRGEVKITREYVESIIEAQRKKEEADADKSKSDEQPSVPRDDGTASEY